MITDGTWKTVNVELSRQNYPHLGVAKLEVGDTIKTHYKHGYDSLVDDVELAEGIVVKSIDSKDVPNDTALFNFTLDGDHTYTAGEDEWVMHNKGGGGGCFVQGTEMTMSNGSTTKVEDVGLLDTLLGVDGKVNRVEGIHNKVVGNRKIVSINKSKFFCTEDHPLKTKDGWKAVNAKMCIQNYPDLNIVNEDLAVGDEIETADGSIVVNEITTKEVSSDTPIWNFTLDGDHTYIAEGLVLHNKCWVARKIYGEDNPDWVVFRHWLENDGPKWLDKLYEKHGEMFAKWVDNKPTIQKTIRKWMDKRIISTIKKLSGEV